MLLTDIKQKDGETLSNYLACFNAEAAAIRQPDERIVNKVVAS